MDDEPRAIGDDIDAVLYRVIPPDAAEKYAALQREYREKSREARKRFRGPEREAKLQELIRE